MYPILNDLFRHSNFIQPKLHTPLKCCNPICRLNIAGISDPFGYSSPTLKTYILYDICIFSVGSKFI